MHTDVYVRAIRALRLSVTMLVFANPRNFFRLWRIARLRGGQGNEEQRAATVINKYRAFTRSQFAAARRPNSGAICVVIPCYNEGQHLPSTLVALARSGNVLPIVVNNNSTDNTAELAAAMGATVLDQPKGKKMAATQRGIQYARHELGARRVLFTDGDTMPLPGWASAMDRRLQELDKGQGAAIFGSIVSMFGSSHLANLAATWLGFLYTIVRDLRGEAPIARGGNYGLSFDDKGIMERKLNSLDQSLFFADPQHPIPEDMQILKTLQQTGTAIAAAYTSDTWVITNNDRMTSFHDIAAIFKRGTSYTDIASKSYIQEYGETEETNQQ